MTLHRFGPLGGLAFAALYVAGTFLPELPEGAYSDERVLALYTDPGSRSAIVAAGFLLALAGVALLPFLAALRDRITGPLGSLAFGGGLLYVAMLFGAGTLWAGYATGIAVGELPPPTDPTLVRVLSDAGFGLLLVYGLVAASAMVLATSLSAAVPRWLRVAGYVVAPLLLLGFAWVPQFLVPLWVLAVSFSLLSTRERVTVLERP